MTTDGNSLALRRITGALFLIALRLRHRGNHPVGHVRLARHPSRNQPMSC